MVLGGTPATCTTVTTTSGTTTACGTPPAMKLYCNDTIAPPDTLQVRALPGANSPGLYVSIVGGFISLNNQSSSSIFPGQFGYTPASVTPPVVLPTNPNLLFTPPPSFSTSTPTSTSSTGQPAVDCAVRARPRARSSRFATSLAHANGPDVAVGDALFFQIGGLAAQAPASMYLNAATTPIGTLKTDGAGTLAGWIRIPSGTPLGTNSFQVSGLLDGNQSVSMITGFTVHAPRSLTLATTTPLTAHSTKLSATSMRALRTLLARVPATVPSTCTLMSYYVPSSKAAVVAQTRQTKTFLATNGLTCKETTKQGSSNIAKVSVHTSR